MSENFEKEPVVSEDLASFRSEINRLKIEEKSDGKTAHLQAIEVGGLSEEDREMWELYTKCEKSGSISEQELDRFLGYKRDVKPFTPSSAFSAFLSNKITRLVSSD